MEVRSEEGNNLAHQASAWHDCCLLEAECQRLQRQKALPRAPGTHGIATRNSRAWCGPVTIALSTRLRTKAEVPTPYSSSTAGNAKEMRTVPLASNETSRPSSTCTSSGDASSAQRRGPQTPASRKASWRRVLQRPHTGSSATKRTPAAAALSKPEARTQSSTTGGCVRHAQPGTLLRGNSSETRLKRQGWTSGARAARTASGSLAQRRHWERRSHPCGAASLTLVAAAVAAASGSASAARSSSLAMQATVTGETVKRRAYLQARPRQSPCATRRLSVSGSGGGQRYRRRAHSAGHCWRLSGTGRSGGPAARKTWSGSASS
mmetsp:Transcript_25191/g.79409  ORF Transcript_25191/g.79409 Transcript_25191/m.79409 type:complete len:321 (-) Transcript_25191:1732-2694(-)